MSTAIFFNPESQRLLGKNQDIPYDGVYIFTNKRGVAKSALVKPPELPARWISRYGSLTISQVGKEMPNGGINEAGLVVEQTTLWQSFYTDDDRLPAIGELQWIQLILDTCATVKEAQQAANEVRITQPMSRLHYMIADRSGDCAIVEFLGGVMHIYRGNSLPISIMANTPYLEAIRDMEDKEAHWRNVYSDYDSNSMNRFIKGANRFACVNKASEGERLQFILETLELVRREDTAYSIIYDLKQMQLHFATSIYPELKTVRINEVDFSSVAVPVALNLQQPAVSYINYNLDLNRMVAGSFFRDPILTKAFDWRITDEMIDFIASFPDHFPNRGN
ncbi:linear amide C-N hydrolase [Paenibacillus sp. N1-5-1-14]|uniref:linear amide C-N hydrolase n=1 Tax=Paenibacillus radicibacter TaxID=2972488 RepID=UPI002158FDF7|nr:linear amide C-N hydrolase [Paenibacillus radicibacter]MCR8641726.1 linear amide C-N hydrolase [Paenibacillus radicibacter]